MHDVVIVGVPLVAILAGIFLNRADGKEIRAEIKDLRTEMNNHFHALEAGMRYFHGVTSKLDARVEAVEKKR